MSKKHPSRNTNQKGDKVQDDGTLWLHSLLCSETHRHHKRSYMTSLHPVKVKALRDTGEILVVGACTPILQFSLYIRQQETHPC